MIRFRGVQNGKTIIVLGLSRENIERLTRGEPILVDGASVAMPEIGAIYLYFGETEAAMLKELAGHVTAATIFHATEHANAIHRNRRN